MITIRIRAKRRGVKLAGAVLAGAAVVVAAALTVAFDGHTDVLAGSGDAPANTTYSQPAGSAMTMGATATNTTPPSAPAVAVATPGLKG
jgi:hypothetical protein